MYMNDEYEYEYVNVNKRCVLVTATICFHSVGNRCDDDGRLNKILGIFLYLFL